MARAFDAYPHKWGLKQPDTNIDHRRVPNLMTFFERQGASLAVTQDARDYKPGDLVTWDLNSQMTHIGVVVNVPSDADPNRLLIVLSDGRPYDHDYGDARYAREDTREALRQARLDGITPFCITIDRDSEAELRDLYGEVGYTIIDDVLTLPERMPAIYRRLTT